MTRIYLLSSRDVEKHRAQRHGCATCGSAARVTIAASDKLGWLPYIRERVTSNERRLAVRWSITPLTEENDPDGSRRDQQLRAIVNLLRNASCSKGSRPSA